MKLLKGLFFATFVSILIAFLVSFYPGGLANSSKLSEVIALGQHTFSADKPIILTEGTLVSVLKQIPIHFTYKQVELDGKSLFIKINVPEADSDKEQQHNQSTIFQDAYLLLDSLYHFTTNTDRVYVRFVHYGEAKNTLLLSVESQRDTFIQDSVQNEKNQEEREAFILEATKIIFGTGWVDESRK